jgi:hypothetical protein
VSTPAVAVQQEPTAFRFFGALAASCARFREDHRDISVSLGVSALVHLALLIAVGASMYTSGEDDRNVPELSVQLETRAGPNSEEFTEAALPKPAPEPPAERVVDDPGTADQTIASDTLGAAAPLAEQIPDTPSEDAVPAAAREPRARRHRHHDHRHVRPHPPDGHRAPRRCARHARAAT